MNKRRPIPASAHSGRRRRDSRRRTLCDQRHIVLFGNRYTVLRVRFQKWERTETTTAAPERCDNRVQMTLVFPRTAGEVPAWNETLLSCIQWVDANAAD